MATAFIAIAAGSTVPLTAEATGVVAGIIAAGTFATVGQCLNGGDRLLLISAGNSGKYITGLLQSFNATGVN
ncbi:hypothetical protein ACQV2C_18880 [Pantoea allii]|uniref:hypothetical protein n=1 Tax=Pantoea allii TaxID=574096 RepID=UPI003D31326D